MPTASAIWKDDFPKSQDAVALQQIKERGALPMIDRGGYPVRQSTVAAISGPPGATGCSSIRLTAWLQKFKEAGGTVREIDVQQSHRDYLPFVICIIVCPSRAVNHYRDNAITYKAQRDKNARELKLANAAITDMQMRQRDVAAWCKIHEGVSWC